MSNGPDSGLVVIGAAENGFDLVKAPTSALASHYFPLFWHFGGLGTCHKLTQHLSVPLLQSRVMAREETFSSSCKDSNPDPSDHTQSVIGFDLKPIQPKS